MLGGAAVLAVGCALVLFAGFCIAISRAFFSRTPSRARFRMAMLWSALLVFGTCGNWLVVSMFGVGVSAAFGGVVVCAAAILSCVLSRFWEARDVLAAVSYLQMSGAAAGGEGFHVQEGSAGVMRVGDHFAAEKDAGCEVAERTPAGVCADAASRTSADAGADGALRMRVDEGTDGAAGFETVCAMTARAYDLTRREEEVLRLLIAGKSFAAIAGELFVSVNTVKTHVRHIYRKMGVNRKEDLSERVFGARSSSD